MVTNRDREASYLKRIVRPVKPAGWVADFMESAGENFAGSVSIDPIKKWRVDYFTFDQIARVQAPTRYDGFTIRNQLYRSCETFNGSELSVATNDLAFVGKSKTTFVAQIKPESQEKLDVEREKLKGALEVFTPHGFVDTRVGYHFEIALGHLRDPAASDEVIEKLGALLPTMVDLDRGIVSLK